MVLPDTMANGPVLWLDRCKQVLGDVSRTSSVFRPYAPGPFDESRVGKHVSRIGIEIPRI